MEIMTSQHVHTPCDLVLQFGNAGNVVLDPEPQLGILHAIDGVFLQLASQWLLSLHPAQRLRLCLELKTEIRRLPRRMWNGKRKEQIFIYSLRS